MLRDLKADLELCQKATPGEWKAVNLNQKEDYAGVYIDAQHRTGRIAIAYDVRLDADAEFIAAARTGWPEAIKRAIKAEQALADLEGGHQ